MADEPVCPEPEPHAALEKKRDKTALLRKALTCTAGRLWPAFRRSPNSLLQFWTKKSPTLGKAGRIKTKIVENQSRITKCA